MRKSKFDRIIEAIALENHTTPSEVRKQMQTAMDEAQKSTDPRVQAKWAAIPKKGDTLTLEEFVEYIAKQVRM